MSRIVTCTAHCSRCDEHFHSTASFDAHRRGPINPKPGQRGRRCIAPEDAADANGEDLFVALSTNARCEIYLPIQKGITVWTLREGYERFKETFETSIEEEPPPIVRSKRKRRRLEDVR